LQALGGKGEKVLGNTWELTLAGGGVWFITLRENGATLGSKVIRKLVLGQGGMWLNGGDYYLHGETSIHVKRETTGEGKGFYIKLRFKRGGRRAG